ncbi:hypothetical protein D3C85_1038190 [compost metagenome]
MAQGLGQFRAGLHIYRNTGAKLAASKVEHIFDQVGRTTATGEDVLHDCAALFVGDLAQQQFGAGRNGEQRVTQVMTEHGDKLFAQFGDFPLLLQLRFGALNVFLALDLNRQQPGKGFHHRLDGTALELCRHRVERTNGSEKTAVSAKHGHRDVTFEAINARRVMLAVLLVGAGVVDHDGLMRGPDLMAQGAGHVQLTAHVQAEAQRVEHGAGGPGAFGHPRHGGETHARGFADNLKNRRYGVDPANGGNVGCDGFTHVWSTSKQVSVRPRLISLASIAAQG